MFTMFNQPLRKSLTVAAMFTATATAWAQPEMVVRIDGQQVASFSEINYGGLNVGQSDQVVVTLRNEGTEDLVFQENPPIQLSGAFTQQFSMVQPALEVGGKLSPNSSTAFAVRFEPTIEFAGINANIFIFTNESAQPFRLRVAGNGLQPELSVRQDATALNPEDEVDFGEVTVGETAELTLQLDNTGTGPLTFTQVAELFGGNGAVAMEIVENAAGQLPAGDTEQLTIRFQPINEGTASTNLFIRSDDPDQETFRLNIKGTGVAPVQEDPQDDDGQDDDEQDENDDQDQDEDDQQGDDQDENDPNNADDQNNQDDPGNEDNDDPNYADDYEEDPNYATDHEDQLDPNELVDFEGDEQDNNEENENDDQQEDEDDNFEDEIEIEIDDTLVTPLTCGFGAGFASLASLASLGGMKRRRRRN